MTPSLSCIIMARHVTKFSAADGRGPKFHDVDYEIADLGQWGALTLVTWLVMHICVSKLTIIGSYNDLSPGRRQAIIWTNAEAGQLYRFCFSVRQQNIGNQTKTTGRPCCLHDIMQARLFSLHIQIKTNVFLSEFWRIENWNKPLDVVLLFFTFRKPLRAKFTEGTYFHFMSLLHIDKIKGSWNPSSCKTRTNLFYVVMAADD